MDDDFSPMRSTEEELLGVDFKRRVGTGITISNPEVTATLESGSDGSPQGIVSGSASIGGTRVSQLIVPVGRNGNAYCLLYAVDTSDGQHLEETRRLEINDDCCA